MTSAIKNFSLFCPTPFEVPASLKKQTEVFGMGEKASLKLAEKLNQQKNSNIIIVYGSAGSLKSEYSPGDTFLVSHINGHELPKAAGTKLGLSYLKTARVSTARKILLTIKEKEDFQMMTGSDLVEMEMGFIWDNVNPEVRENLVFIRGVIDESKTELPFLSDHGFNLKSFIYPSTWIALIKFMGDLKKYKKGMESVFQKISTN